VISDVCQLNSGIFCLLFFWLCDETNRKDFATFQLVDDKFLIAQRERER
jgi:hypothetical protein